MSATNRRPLVSVGVPVYNGEEYLAEALASAVAQDHDNVEIVIADNASTDGTEEICRHFARSDPRVRYVRNPENVGSRANFDLVLTQARGKYFTWLAHDDLLSDPGYLRATCDALEANPDVVLCGSSMNVLGQEGPGTEWPALLPEIYPDKDWRRAREVFFRCPYDTRVFFAIYGVFRRDVLRSVPIVDRSYKGKRVVLDLENPILAEVAVRGRIIALPELLRSYRHHEHSSWHVDMDRLNGWDRFWLRLGMKATIFRIAAKAPLPLGERLRLVRIAAGNFFHNVFGTATDYKAQVKELKRQNLILRRDCDERLEIIRLLQTEREALLARESENALVTLLAAQAAELAALRQQLAHAVREASLRNVPRRLVGKLTSLVSRRAA